MRRTDTSTLSDLILTLTGMDTTTGKSDYVMLKFDYVVNELVKRTEMTQDFKKGYFTVVEITKKHNF